MTKPLAIGIVEIRGFARMERVEVRISRSKARAAGPCGVSYQAPGRVAVCFKSLDAAQRRLERFPGFIGWAS